MALGKSNPIVQNDFMNLTNVTVAEWWRNVAPERVSQ
jgi:hypothetical protein